MPVLQDGELVLYGFVGDNYWDEGFTAQDVLYALSEVGRDTDITVRINSSGGYVDDGIAIYNALLAHKGKVTVKVDALAASAASIIAMAGEERIMRSGAMIMIHDPASYTYGNAGEHEKSRAKLDKLGDQMAGIYADRTGEDEDIIREDMRDEVWLTGAEAVARGFATSTEDQRAVAVSAFDFRVYAHAPDSLKRLAAKKSWSFERERPAAASASVKTSQEEQPMADTPQADAVTADIAAEKNKITARIKAIMTSPEAEKQPEQAKYLAYDTDVTADAAIAIMAKGTEPVVTDDADPMAYEQDRMRGSGLSAPQPRERPKANLNHSDIFAARRAAVKGA